VKILTICEFVYRQYRNVMHGQTDRNGIKNIALSVLAHADTRQKTIVDESINKKHSESANRRQGSL